MRRLGAHSATWRTLRLLTILLGLLFVFEQHKAWADPPMSVSRAQSFSDTLRQSGDVDQQAYAAAKADLQKKVDQARQHPEQAESIASGLYYDLIKHSPAEEGGYTPTNKGRSIAAFEAYIEILNNAAAKQAEPPQPKSTATATPPPNPSGDEHAEVIANEIVKGATSGVTIDIGKFLPGGSSTITNTNTNTRTETNINTGTRTGTTVNTSVRTGAANNSNSTITGLSSDYRQITPSAAQDIVGKYKSIPGGVTLEGGSSDLSFIRSASYVAWANAFVLNGDVVYLNPVSPSEFVDIDRALAADDRLGVSLGALAIVYGALPPESEVGVNLELADTFLGDIAFGRHRVTRGYVFAPGYKGETPGASPNLAVYFNIHSYRFAKDADGYLARSGVALDTTLVPLLPTVGVDGGHLPDFDKINKSDLPKEYVANLKHLQNNIAYYARERIVRTAIAYGEAAAFARALKANGVKLDLATIAKNIPAITPATAASAGGDPCALAATHWTSTESIGTREAYDDHLARFPNCAFATLARARIAALTERESGKSSVVKTCPAGLVTDFDGDCVRKKKEERRASGSRHTTPGAAPQTDIISQGLNCARTTDLMTCANRALSTLPLNR